MKFSKVKNVKTPTRGTGSSAGIDFYTPNDFEETILNPNDSILIPSGIKMDIPRGFMLTAFNKSGIATKKSILVGACVCDEDYEGEIHIHLINVGKESQTIEPGQKIIQFILIPVFYDHLEEVSISNLFLKPTSSERKDGGFGSTGI